MLAEQCRAGNWPHLGAARQEALLRAVCADAGALPLDCAEGAVALLSRRSADSVAEPRGATRVHISRSSPPAAELEDFAGRLCEGAAHRVPEPAAARTAARLALAAARNTAVATAVAQMADAFAEQLDGPSQQPATIGDADKQPHRARACRCGQMSGQVWLSSCHVAALTTSLLHSCARTPDVLRPVTRARYARRAA
jgi:hypothetical protein